MQGIEKEKREGRLNGINMNGKDPRRLIEELIMRIKKGDIAPETAWNAIKSAKEYYIRNIRNFTNVRDAEQSWHSYIGNKFQELIYEILKRYVEQLKKDDEKYRTLCVLNAGEVRRNDILFRKVAVRYGDFLLLPDLDICIADCTGDWNSKILCVVSCKTSLRERIAQACYWKLKFLASDVTKHIKIYLVTTDNDKDFFLNRRRREEYSGKSRNRIISEYELDGIYILREDFSEEMESEKVKKYEKIFDDLKRIFGK